MGQLGRLIGESPSPPSRSLIVRGRMPLPRLTERVRPAEPHRQSRTMPGTVQNEHMTDQPRDKFEQEDRVVRSFLKHLQVLRIHSDLVERPDRCAVDDRTYPKVTSDALVRITTGDTTVNWAVDVTSLAAPGEHVVVLNALHERLEPLAQQHKVVITITGGVTPRTNELQGVQDAVTQALRPGERTGSMSTHGLGITWRPAACAEDPGLQIQAMILRSNSAELSQQVEETLRSPLTDKATNQARRAREAGCRTAVVIDRVGHQKIGQGSHWLVRCPNTIGEAVDNILATLDHALDAVLLHGLNGDWHLLFGKFPGMDSVA